MYQSYIDIMDRRCRLVLSSVLPLMHYDCMPGSGVRLRRSGDKTGLDKKPLLRSGVGRNLEVYYLSSFVYIRLCGASPEGCKERASLFYSKRNQTTFMCVTMYVA